MKVTSLQLNNFRSHEGTQLELDRITFIVGANKTGKSSIAMAFEYLLCGTCEVTDESGKNADELIRQGTAEMSVTASFEVEGKQFFVDRKRSGNQTTLTAGVEGKSQLVGKMATDWMAANLPAPGVLQALLNSSRFVDLDANAQKRLLSSVLADQGIAVADDLKKPLASLWADGEVPARLTIAQLDKVHKAAYDRRTLLNRDLKQIGELTAPETKEVAKQEDIKAKLDGLRSDRDLLLTQKNEELHAYASEAACREELQSEIEGLAALILPMDKEKELKDSAEKENDLKASVGLAANLRAQIEARNSDCNSLAKLGSKAACPTCHRAITKKELETIAGTIKGHINDLHERLKHADAQEAEYQVMLQSRERIATSIRACAEKEQLEAELAKVPAVGAAPDTSGIDAQIAKLDERISNGQDALATASALREKIKHYNDSAAKLEKAKTELKVIEKVLAFAGPDGARKQAAAGKLPIFKEAMNEALQPFGFVVGMELEPYSFSVLEQAGNVLPRSLNQLSESERFRFSVAFQIALATVTGLGFVVIDRADVLDKESRRQLSAMLMASKLEQAIVCSTSTDPIPERVPEGVRFIQLEKGDGGTQLANVSPKQAVAA